MMNKSCENNAPAVGDASQTLQVTTDTKMPKSVLAANKMLFEFKQAMHQYRGLKNVRKQAMRQFHTSTGVVTDLSGQVQTHTHTHTQHEKEGKPLQQHCHLQVLGQCTFT